MINAILGRVMMTLGFMIFVALFSYEAFAAELSVFDIHRNIPLSDEEPIYKDYYINAGDEAGLKKNLVIKAVRRVPMRDASGSQIMGELLVPVGQLKVIFVQPKLSVARLYKLMSRDELPMLDQEGILIGDQVDLQGSFIDNKKLVPEKRKTASVPTVVSPAVAVGLPAVPAAVHESVQALAEKALSAPAPEKTIEQAKVEVSAEAIESASIAVSSVPPSKEVSKIEMSSLSPAVNADTKVINFNNSTNAGPAPETQAQ